MIDPADFDEEHRVAFSKLSIPALIKGVDDAERRKQDFQMLFEYQERKNLELVKQNTATQQTEQ